MGLYDAVRREEKPRRRWHPMWVVALAFAAALVTVLGLTISKPQRDHDRFIRCISDISSSTTYAFSGKFTSLRARWTARTCASPRKTAMPCTGSSST